MRALTVLASALVLLGTGCDDKKEEKKTEAAASSASASPASTSAAPIASAAPSAAASAAPSASAAVPDAIAAQHVLVTWKGAQNAPATVTRSKADAKKRAEEVVAKAKGGSDFSALVTEYSDDAGTKERRGSLGKFSREKMVKPFSDAAFTLRIDEVSGPVETPFGFHVIKRNQ